MDNTFSSIEWFAYGNNKSKDLYARIDGKWFRQDLHNHNRLVPLSSILVDDIEGRYLVYKFPRFAVGTTE